MQKKSLTQQLVLKVITGKNLSTRERSAVLALCTRAYEIDFEPLFHTLVDATHVLAYQSELLVSHALWVTRWLQWDAGPLMCTAYVEAVATEEGYRRRGYASAVMQRLAAEVQGFDLGALCPAEHGIYQRLGWEAWRGPLFIRTAQGLLPTPDEEVMILRLPHTPELDLTAPLAAEWREGELW